MKKKTFLPFVILLTLGISLACSTLTNPASSPLPTLPPFQISLLRDDFSSLASGWGTGTDDFSSIEYSSGTLLFKVFDSYYISWSGPNLTDYTDVRVEVDAQNNSSSDGSMFGVICHEQVSQDFYFLGVDASGYYAIGKSIVGQDNVYLAEGTSASIPGAGQSVTIGADCGNGTLALYFNGEELASAQDTTFTSGYVGLFVWSDETPNSAEVAFDNFKLEKIP